MQDQKEHNWPIPSSKVGLLSFIGAKITESYLHGAINSFGTKIFFKNIAEKSWCIKILFMKKLLGFFCICTTYKARKKICQMQLSENPRKLLTTTTIASPSVGIWN